MNTEKLVKKVNKHDNDIIKVNEQLDNVVQDTEESFDSLYKNNLRIFKPTFGFNNLGRACCDVTTFDEQKEFISKFVEIGMSSFAYCIRIKETSGILVIDDDIELIKNNIDFCKSNNIEIPLIHIYQDDTITFDTSFSSKYSVIVNEVLNLFANVNYKYVVIWNERTSDLINQNVINGIVNACTVVKTKGKQAGIALQSFTPFGGIVDTILDSCDFYGINHYPFISNDEENSTIAQGINGWENTELLYDIDYIKTLYPSKDILITETGIISSWRALSNPSYWLFDWQTYDYTGKVNEIYYIGMLELFKNSSIKYVFGWYPHDFIKNVDAMKNLYSHYIKGGK